MIVSWERDNYQLRSKLNKHLCIILTFFNYHWYLLIITSSLYKEKVWLAFASTKSASCFNFEENIEDYLFDKITSFNYSRRLNEKLQL